MPRTGDYIPAEVRREVIRRASNQCEYCQLPDDDELHYYAHQIDHIRSLKHRGTNDIGNLAYACVSCNGAKGADLGSIYDPTGDFVPFYNPRAENWDDHFRLVDHIIEPLTATGWVTATMLLFNTPDRIETRRLL